MCGTIWKEPPPDELTAPAVPSSSSSDESWSPTEAEAARAASMLLGEAPADPRRGESYEAFRMWVMLESRRGGAGASVSRGEMTDASAAAAADPGAGAGAAAAAAAAAAWAPQTTVFPRDRSGKGGGAPSCVGGVAGVAAAAATGAWTAVGATAATGGARVCVGVGRGAGIGGCWCAASWCGGSGAAGGGGVGADPGAALCDGGACTDVDAGATCASAGGAAGVGTGTGVGAGSGAGAGAGEVGVCGVVGAPSRAEIGATGRGSPWPREPSDGSGMTGGSTDGSGSAPGGRCAMGGGNATGNGAPPVGVELPLPDGERSRPGIATSGGGSVTGGCGRGKLGESMASCACV